MPQKPTKTKRVVFLVTPSEHDELTRRAAAQGESVGEYIRSALWGYDFNGGIEDEYRVEKPDDQ
jgi:predicted HicB family RNase H-like nuclease